MASKHGVYVYPHDCEDFTTTGMVGDLKPLQAVFTEKKNGESYVTIRLPYDEFNRWKAAKVGNIIKCEVPIRVPPAITDDEFADTVQVGR